MTKTVAFFGSARVDKHLPIYAETHEAAAYMARLGWEVATGGGPGLMEAANKGASGECENSTCSLGYSIYLPHEQCANDWVQSDYHHSDFFARLYRFTDTCDAFIALPGGYGTLLEIMSVVQLLQVGHMNNKPLILVGSMWQSLMETTSRLLWTNRMIREDEQSYWWYARTPMEAARRLTS